jgi:two-component system, OmpR family, phosphate regulon sensor histidine kinase PhoR
VGLSAEFCLVEFHFRKRRRLHIPFTITLSVVLVSLDVLLMVFWIILLARQQLWGGLAIGTVGFSVILCGIAAYMVIAVKEIRLNQRQANFVDSVTHELKSPIATLRLYLETLQMRKMEDVQRAHFYEIMEGEIQRLSDLINQLLEVGRLDAIGQRSDPVDVPLEPLLRRCAASASAHHKRDEKSVFSFDIEPAVVHARPMVLEMIFGNLLDNAIKYGAEEPAVDVQVRIAKRGRIVTRVCDNGAGVPTRQRKKIFQLFYRGGSELERTQKGTGLGLYIVRTLVHMLKGTITVREREGGHGSVFEVSLPGRSELCES